MPSHTLDSSSSNENSSPGPASYMITVKSTVGPPEPPTGPTANGVADGKVYRPAASGVDAVPAIGTARYSSGVPDTKDANGSLISAGVGGPPVPVVKTSDANVPSPTKSYSQPEFPSGKLPLPVKACAPKP